MFIVELWGILRKCLLAQQRERVLGESLLVGVVGRNRHKLGMQCKGGCTRFRSTASLAAAAGYRLHSELRCGGDKGERVGPRGVVPSWQGRRMKAELARFTHAPSNEAECVSRACCACASPLGAVWQRLPPLSSLLLLFSHGFCFCLPVFFSLSQSTCRTLSTLWNVSTRW